MPADRPAEGPAPRPSIDRSLLVTAAILGAVGVAAGAFGAHGLTGKVSPARLSTFETGVRYLLLHVPVLLVLAVLRRWMPSRLLSWAGSLMVAGVLVFSGSLGLLVLLDLPWMGAITPIGGTLLIAGWVVLAIAGARQTEASSASR